MTNFDEEAKNWDANPLRVARANAVAAAIQSHLPLAPTMRALEYGSGTGLLSFALRPYLGHITLADSSPGMLAVLHEKIAAAGATLSLRALQLDLATEPTPAERFQLIYTLMTLHHIADTGKILRDFFTLLDPGGWLCIADLDQEDGTFHGSGFDGHMGFDRGALAEKARQAGLTNITFNTVFQMPKVVAGRKKDFPRILDERAEAVKFYKYHALGNDYIVLDPLDQPLALTPAQIHLLCHRHYGLGGDGVLLGPRPSRRAAFGLRIFNPDGSEAEKSGNGLCIFSRYLWDRQRVGTASFEIDTPGGVVRAWVLEAGRQVRVAMGRVSFWSADIPVLGDGRDVLAEPLRLGDADFRFSAATLGNPHCVIVVPEVSSELAQHYGPLAERDPLFPHRTNVQFVKVLDPANLQIEIWERGAGYTLASGSSSCAAAAVLRRLGQCAAEVTVHMPGGKISVALDEKYGAVLTGPVTRVGEGQLDEALLQIENARVEATENEAA